MKGTKRSGGGCSELRTRSGVSFVGSIDGQLGGQTKVAHCEQANELEVTLSLAPCPETRALGKDS